VAGSVKNCVLHRFAALSVGPSHLFAAWPGKYNRPMHVADVFSPRWFIFRKQALDS